MPYPSRIRQIEAAVGNRVERGDPNDKILDEVTEELLVERRKVSLILGKMRRYGSEYQHQRPVWSRLP